ncbi:hypothetical protein [Methylobacterium platani]|uniref:Transposase n=2 Tax=Methylobacterium platani TaxID=427683 RepID=A0A179RYR0_9HYPH|nr:hypothetical protein [Methylobacterium platani]KMO14847.1 hypothetical protein SQ03_18300 [Methylobacterium platani JCM 14648]OAS16168.1 hypothetical protein A5481_28460 [Methylobacterium platani]
MASTSQSSAEFLAIMLENAELRLALATAQDQCVELAVIAGELHGEIEALKLRIAEIEQGQAGGGTTPLVSRSDQAGDHSQSLRPATELG